MIETKDEKILSDINVTPFIDVMLVLLIIFMTVTPLMTSSDKIELPKVGKNFTADKEKFVIISIDKNGIVSINSKVIHLADLSANLALLTSENFEETIYFYVDTSVEYGTLMNTIKKVKELGYLKIALSSQIND